jgi:hypothetical protein
VNAITHNNKRAKMFFVFIATFFVPQNPNAFSCSAFCAKNYEKEISAVL